MRSILPDSILLSYRVTEKQLLGRAELQADIHREQSIGAGEVLLPFGRPALAAAGGVSAVEALRHVNTARAVGLETAGCHQPMGLRVHCPAGS